jgi:PAS domain S-box-containing protein
MRKPPNEKERIARLRSLNVLDPSLDPHLKSVVKLASEIANCPISYISFIETDREIIRFSLGIEPCELARELSVTSETILSTEPLIVEMNSSPLSLVNRRPLPSHPELCFYAGFPLISQERVVIGALCLVDTTIHSFSDAQTRTLQSLASLIVSQITISNKLAAVQRTISSLEDSEQRFRRVADASPVLLWIADPAGNRTLSNKAWCDFTGLSQEESLAECWRDAVHPDDLAVYKTKWAECVRDHSRFQHEFRLRHRSGTFQWVMEQAIPLFSSNGRLEAYVSSCVDLSLRNSEELQYQHNEARFRAISEAAPLGIVVTDSRGNCIYSNHKFQDLSGLSTDESLGSGWLRSVHPEDAPDLHTAWSEATKTAQSFERVFRYVRPDSSIAWCSLKTATINSTDTVSGWVSTIEDITEKRKAEADLVAAKQAAEAAMHSKSQFIANISHEIRTPLTAIIGFADSLRHEHALEPAQNLCLDVILNNGKHLLTVINQILDLSKIDAGALAVEALPCDLVGLVEELLTMFAPTASEKSLALEASYQWPLPKYISTDPLRLKQVLINLVGNAIKFTAQGGVTIRISWCANSQQARFSISDTGIGMTSDQCTNLFTPFYQANDSITRMFGGTGLGLSISQRLIKAMGGSIEVHSTPSKGSVFTFSVQSKGPPEHVFVQSLAREALPADRTVKTVPALAGRVLFADDALDNRRLVEHLIRQTGADVVLVENGREAIEAATSSAFDLILMDVQMPIIDGLSATRSIRRAGVKTPIVAVSAGAMISDIEKALDAGCSLHLGKPFERTALYDILSRFVRASPGLPEDGNTPILSTVSADDPEMQTLLSEFINGLPGRHSELEIAWRSNDGQRVAALAHKLKGSAGMYGYPLLASEARKLEQAAKAEKSADVSTAIATIGQIIDQIGKAEPPLATNSASHRQVHDQKPSPVSAQDQSRTRPH